jgi:hypothetical protein
VTSTVVRETDLPTCACPWCSAPMHNAWARYAFTVKAGAAQGSCTNMPNVTGYSDGLYMRCPSCGESFTCEARGSK